MNRQVCEDCKENIWFCQCDIDEQVLLDWEENRILEGEE